MKSWIILIVVAVATMVTASVAVPLLDSGSGASVPRPIVAPTTDVTKDAPHVEVDQPLTFEFSPMAQDTEQTHRWMFKNTGKATLELRNLGTDCSCTIAQVGKTDASGNKPTMLPVKPGAAEPIELTWNSRKGGEAYRKNARIGTNDPANPEVVLTVRGKVYPALTVVPTDNVVNFMAVTNDEDAVRKVVIFSQDRPGTKITRLETQNKALIALASRPMTAEELASFKVQAGTIIDITLKTTDRLGAFKEEVLIETDHPQKPEVRLNVTGRVTGPITFAPEKVMIRGATSSEGGSGASTIWVRGRPAAKFEVAKAPPGLDVAFAPLPQPAGVTGSQYRMTVRVLPGTPAGQINDEIVIRTDHPKAAEIRVPVDALVLSNE